MNSYGMLPVSWGDYGIPQFLPKDFVENTYHLMADTAIRQRDYELLSKLNKVYDEFLVARGYPTMAQQEAARKKRRLWIGAAALLALIPLFIVQRKVFVVVICVLLGVALFLAALFIQGLVTPVLAKKMNWHPSSSFDRHAASKFNGLILALVAVVPGYFLLSAAWWLILGEWPTWWGWQ